MTTAYAAIAAGGRGVTPYAIKEIANREGEVLYRRDDPDLPRVVDSSAIETLSGMLEEVIKTGTGKRAELGGRPVAGKTGTSSDYRDAWFFGYTGDYTTGVWMGNDDNHPMQKVTGGSLPAQLWHDYMVEAEEGLPEHALLSYGSFWGTTSAASQGLSHAFTNFINGVLGGDDAQGQYPNEGRGR